MRLCFESEEIKNFHDAVTYYCVSRPSDMWRGIRIYLSVFNKGFLFFSNIFFTEIIFLAENLKDNPICEGFSVYEEIYIRALCLDVFKFHRSISYFLAEFYCNLGRIVFKLFCKEKAGKRIIPHFRTWRNFNEFFYFRFR